MTTATPRHALELELIRRLGTCRSELFAMLDRMSGHWEYEDAFYRFYHHSFKVYTVQDTTRAAVEQLRALLPGRPLNALFERIVADGTGHVFDVSHNADWERHTRPILEAFAHARFMVDMSVRYSTLTEPPRPLPSGYAALLYLFDLR